MNQKKEKPADVANTPIRYYLNFIEVGSKTDNMDKWGTWTHTGLNSDDVKKIEAVIKIMALKYYQIQAVSDEGKADENYTVIESDPFHAKLKEYREKVWQKKQSLANTTLAFNKKMGNTVKLAEDDDYSISVGYRAYELDTEGLYFRHNGALVGMINVEHRPTGKKAAYQLFWFTAERSYTGKGVKYAVISSKLDKLLVKDFPKETPMSIDLMKTAMKEYDRVENAIKRSEDSPARARDTKTEVTFD